MSYTIIYNRCFIKLDSDKVVPMILVGSSNGTQISDSGKEIRERYWAVDYYIGKGELTITQQRVIDFFNEERKHLQQTNPPTETDEGYLDSQFGYHQGIHFYGNRPVTFNSLRAFYLNGVKTAKTVEEIVSCGVSIQSRYETSNGSYEYGTIRTTEDLHHFFHTLLLLRPKYFRLEYIGAHGIERLLKRKKTAPPFTLVKVSNYFVLTYKDLGYFVKSTARRTTYSYTHYSAKKFQTESKAAQFIKNSSIKEHLSIKPIDEPTTFKQVVKPAKTVNHHQPVATLNLV